MPGIPGLRRRPDSRAFHELLATLRAYERKFLWRRFLRGDNELAEGYKATLDLLSLALDCYLDDAPERPRFVQIVSPWRKLGGDNADALYYFAPLSPGKRYRVRGTAGRTVYVGFTIYGGAEPDRFHIVSNLASPDLEVAPDGSFEVTVSADPRPEDPNVLRTDATANCLMVRRYFLDKQGMRDEPGVQIIEADEEAPIPANLTAEEMARRIRSITAFLRGWFRLVPVPMPPVPMAYNRMGKPRQASADTGHWSTPDNHHAFGFYRLKPDEVLYVRGRAPECIYWSVHLWNPFLQTYDYVHHRSALNSSEVELDDQRRFELAIAHRDFGHPNFVDTTGKERGFVYFRFLKAQNAPEPLQTEVRKIPT